MDDKGKAVVGEASKKVLKRPYNEITSVIFMGPWTFKERLACAAATAFIGGLVFFLIWVYVGFSSGGPWPSLFLPIGATAFMTTLAFIHPGWSEYLLEKMFSYPD